VSDIFRCEKLIRFAHCDPAGIVFYPRYVELFAEVVEDWFEQALDYGYATMHKDDRLGVPVVRLEVDYLAPSRLGERIRFELRVNRIGRASIDLALDGFCGAQHRLTGRQVIVVMDLDRGSAQPVPECLRDKIARFVVDGSAGT